MGWSRPRVLYITRLNEAAAQGSLGRRRVVMRKVSRPPWRWSCGGGWGEREEPCESTQPTVWVGHKWRARLPKWLEPGWRSEGNARWTERVGGG